MSSQLPLITGIQQIGIGNDAVYDTWEWYRSRLGFTVPVFDEAAEAALMLPYTGGEPRKRHAILALNMMGGGGTEIWQYTSRIGQAPSFTPRLGDLGIFIAKYKSIDIARSYGALMNEQLLSPIAKNPAGDKHFYLKDPFDNVIEIVESNNWFNENRFHCGGIYGSVIGVSDMDKSLAFYKDILGYDKILSDNTGPFDDFIDSSLTEGNYRRVILTHTEERVGPFSKLFGNSQIELVQALDRAPNKIFANRMWGDLGYIHLCFDVVGMNEMREKCKAAGCAFTVDSGDFDMGEAAGQFAYIEDPDGTLIEFVEAHKIPIMKKLGWYLDLKKRDPAKPLPRWMLQAMGLGQKKSPVNS